MKKLCIIIICALLPGIAFSQYLSKEFTLDETDVVNPIALNVSVSNQDSVISINGSHAASGLFISGCATLSNDDDSYVRITLMDTDSNEYLIYELYPLLAESRHCPFTKVGLETAYLDNIHPQSIKIETLNASATLDSVYFVVPERSARNMLKAIPNRKSQCEHIVSRLNDRLIARHKTWRAGLTFVAQMTFEEKKGMFGGKVPVLHGFDYYKGGVFVMPGFYQSVSHNANTRTSDNYVTEWDWRNRHGKNWVTSVKDQGNCGSCWAFSALGTVESYINLYYNKILNLDLSEQEIISFTSGVSGDCNGGYVYDALQHTKNFGAVLEECFVYQATDTIPYYSSFTCDLPDRIIIDDYSADYSDSFPVNPLDSFKTEEDSIKRMLFKSPITFGINHPWKHFVVLVGYKQFQTGNYYYTYNHKNDSVFIDSDSLANHPAWLIKNSMGLDWGQEGYGYLAMSLFNVYGIHKLKGNVKSDQLLLTDDDIVCEDADGDGYFNWGIKDSTFTLPAWAPTEEDGDDSDCTKGPIDEFGNLRVIDPDAPENSDTIFIDMDDNITYSIPKYSGRHIKITDEAYLTISSHLFCCKGVSITIEKDCRLIISGGVLENVILKPQPGSCIIIEGGGRIIHNKDVNFQIPLGVTFEQNHGKIE